MARQCRDLPVGCSLAGKGLWMFLPPCPNPCPMEPLVARRRQQETPGGKAIPSRPARFLDIRLQGRRHAEVDHEADR
jgi:hypothetical protein